MCPYMSYMHICPYMYMFFFQVYMSSLRVTMVNQASLEKDYSRMAPTDVLPSRSHQLMNPMLGGLVDAMSHLLEVTNSD